MNNFFRCFHIDFDMFPHWAKSKKEVFNPDLRG